MSKRTFLSGCEKRKIKCKRQEENKKMSSSLLCWAKGKLLYNHIFVI